MNDSDILTRPFIIKTHLAYSDDWTVLFNNIDEIIHSQASVIKGERGALNLNDTKERKVNIIKSSYYFCKNNIWFEQDKDA